MYMYTTDMRDLCILLANFAVGQKLKSVAWQKRLLMFSAGSTITFWYLAVAVWQAITNVLMFLPLYIISEHFGDDTSVSFKNLLISGHCCLAVAHQNCQAWGRSARIYCMLHMLCLFSPHIDNPWQICTCFFCLCLLCFFSQLREFSCLQTWMIAQTRRKLSTLDLTTALAVLDLLRRRYENWVIHKCM